MADKKQKKEKSEGIDIYHFALKYLAVFEIEFQESVNAISWKYADDRKTAIIYKKPWHADNGKIYFGEIFDRHAVCKRKFIDALGANAFIDEATKAIEDADNGEKA